MLARYPLAAIVQPLAGIVFLCFCSHGHGQNVVQSFVVHGKTRSCSAITQLDSALESNSLQFFDGWSAQDYADAMSWSLACADYGWHVRGRPRVPLLQAQHDTAVGPAPAPVATVAPVAWGAGLLTQPYLAKHFRQEALRVAQQAHLDIGTNGGPGRSSAKSPAQTTNRLTADKIVLFCARQSSPGESENRPLLTAWRRCESEEASAYHRLVAGNEFPAAGRGIVLGCAGVESYLDLERCMGNLAAAARP